MNNARLSCFVIGPIGDRLAPVGSVERDRFESALEVYERVIQEACDLLGLVPVRADDVSKAGEIPEQIFRRLRDADIVIADLTDANPNVMYELGLRHSTNGLTVQIGEHGRLPFDIAAVRTIQFVRTPRGLVDARERLKSAIEASLSEGADQVAATRVFQNLPVPERQIAPRPEDERPGFLEVLADMEVALPAMSVDLQGATELIKEIGALAQQGTDAMRKNDSQGGGASGRLGIAVRFAHALDEKAAELEERTTAYENNLSQVDAGMDYMLSRVEAEPHLIDELGDFVTGVRGMADAAKANFPQADHLAGIVENMAGVARPLRTPTRRTGDALRRLSRSSSVIEAWQSRLAAVTAQARPRGSPGSGRLKSTAKKGG